jgi:hypothetical protein
MLLVWSITTKAKEPSWSPRASQNGNVIEQSGVPPTRVDLAFGDPFVRLEGLLSNCRRENEHLNGKREKKIHAIGKCRTCICGCLVVVAPLTEPETRHAWTGHMAEGIAFIEHQRR